MLIVSYKDDPEEEDYEAVLVKLEDEGLGSTRRSLSQRVRPRQPHISNILMYPQPSTGPPQHLYVWDLVSVLGGRLCK